MSPRLEILVGRIETMAVDAVVNAANTRLLPGGGVDGALRRAAGPALTEHTSALAPIGEGEALVTPAFLAPAKAIIHTAAPVWLAPGSTEDKQTRLAACYRNSLMLADQNAFVSIAFPCLGTGAFAWPRELARDIAIRACREAAPQAARVRHLIFCCFSEEDGALYRAALD